MTLVFATFLLSVISVPTVLAQMTQMSVQPQATSADTVYKESDPVCSVRLVVEHKLTMVLEQDLIHPQNGRLTNSTD
ncbi:hypothetical protein DPMN_046644 [Dreissena polymorpha]|uniref:Uncharacterized protein n=1 Tax=Dreissena polymorpha TaxID=45954 RepID=A0A9D4D774_DREPO|nr:hypothetical protein DPMN_046644 [Dreissena polymorpha]